MSEYIGVSAFDLVERSHNSNGAWYQIYGTGEGNHKQIPFDIIEAIE